MRIAQVAPLAEPVPPPLYGGTERVVSVLTEGLVRRGHEVTLFASGDSRTSARLVPCAPRGLRLDASVKDTVAPTLIELGEVYRRAAEFDVIHNHVDYCAFPLTRLSNTPTVTTTHGRLDLAEVRKVYDMYPEQKLVSISRDQASWLPHANWIANVYHGIDVGSFPFRSAPGDYLAFVGRIHPDKRPDRAIELARDVGMRIVIAAKVADVDEDYYRAAVKPLVDSSPLVEFIGEVDEAGKAELLGGAYACLFPIDWPEPFGLCMVESMATGTPVIAYRQGSVPEVVVDGVTGFVCDSFAGMVSAIERVGEIDRAKCREHVERNFSADLMVSRYEAVYQSAVGIGRRAPDRLMPPPVPSLTGAGSEAPNDLARVG
jgi:glycosyltransferase involved in cell wall biosynthesis